MTQWYIDRCRNINAIFNGEIYQKLVAYSKDDIWKNKRILSSELIKMLNISGSNPNAVLSFLRDTGFITSKNKPTEIFLDFVESGLSNDFFILNMLVKRNSLKEEENKIKPFIIICKVLNIMNKEGFAELDITWNDCCNYLIDITDYRILNEGFVKNMVLNRSDKDAFDKYSVLDIWFNALNNTPLFDGNRKKLVLNKKYLPFIEFISKYGDEMQLSNSKEEYLFQIGSPKYGIIELVKNHSYEALRGLSNLEQLFKLINLSMNDNDNKVTLKGYNKLYYGVPGCGKSYKIDKEILKSVPKEMILRTTFYLDYSNSDFVGQILPVVNGDKITYNPIPGPFTKALKLAYENKNDMVYLVIEEINRGNAAAIFGDLFQLLDRFKDEKDGTIGESEYPITNNFIENYFSLEKVTFTKGSIIIPSNLTILATMNTSDQNVFPLDTAFKRRWQLERIQEDWEKCTFKDWLVPGTEWTWKNFVLKINQHIVNDLDSGINMEDKQIGAFFVDKSCLIKPKNFSFENCKNEEIYNLLSFEDRLNNFNYKLLEYLWDDVSKFHREYWFKEVENQPFPKSFDQLLDIILKYNLRVFAVDFESAIETSVNEELHN